MSRVKGNIFGGTCKTRRMTCRGLLGLLLVFTLVMPLAGIVATGQGSQHIVSASQTKSAEHFATAGAFSPATGVTLIPTLTTGYVESEQISWENIDDAKIEDGACASSSGSSDVTCSTGILKTYGYGFAIPTNATIRGIKVEIKGYATTTGGAAMLRNQLCKSGDVGGLTGENKFYGDMPTSMSWITFGSENDLWNAAWTPSEINDLYHFGHAMAFIMNISSPAVTVHIDAVRVTVYYDLPPGRGITGLDTKWTYKAGWCIISRPAVTDINGDGLEEVFVGSLDQYLYCLTGAGALIWRYMTGSYIISTPDFADVDGDGHQEIVFGSQDCYVYCLNNTGGLEWKFMTGGYIYSSPAISDIDGDGQLEIVVGSFDQYIYCFNATGAVEWRYMTGGEVYSSPVIADVDGDGLKEIVIGCGTGDSNLYCLDGNGSLKWLYSTGGWIYGAPAVGDVDGDQRQEIIIASNDLKVRCLVCTTNFSAAEKWSFYTHAAPSYPSMGDVDGDGEPEVLVGSLDNYVYCLDGDGAFMWAYMTQGQISSAPVVADLDHDGLPEVVATSQDHNVYVINGTGALMANYTAGGSIDSSPAIADVDLCGNAEILVGASNGVLYCLTGGASGSAPPRPPPPPPPPPPDGPIAFPILTVSVISIGALALVLGAALFLRRTRSGNLQQPATAYKKAESSPRGSHIAEEASRPISAHSSSTCPQCGAPHNASDRYCMSCGASMEATFAAFNLSPSRTRSHPHAATCMVCGGRLFGGREILSCPNCGSPAHKEHLLEWLHVKNYCPACGRRLTQRDVSG